MCRNIKQLYNFEPHASHHLIEDLVTQAAPRDRDVEAAKARARSIQRFGK